MRKLLIDHHELLKPAGEPGQKPGITEAVVMDVSVSQHLHPTRPEPHLWSGMILQAKGDLATALWQKDGYIVETLEEEIAAAEQGQKDTNGKLKFTLEQGGMKQQLKNEVHVEYLKLVDWHTEW